MIQRINSQAPPLYSLRKFDFERGDEVIALGHNLRELDKVAAQWNEINNRQDVYYHVELASEPLALPHGVNRK